MHFGTRGTGTRLQDQGDFVRVTPTGRPRQCSSTPERRVIGGASGAADGEDVGDPAGTNKLTAREGTPNCVLEAMALETPIVATAAGGTGELVTDGVEGLLVPIHDVPALEAALDAALSDRAGAATRVAAARNKVETDLSFDRRMRRVEEVYVNLMTSAGRTEFRGSPQAAR